MKRFSRHRNTVVHLCISDGFWGVENYVYRAIVSQRLQGINSIPIGNKQLEKHFSNTSLLFRFGLIGRIFFIMKLRPEVIHSHMTKAEFLAFFLSKCTKSKLVSTRHFAKARGSHWISRRFSRIYNKNCNIQISVSNFVRDRIEFSSSTVIYPGTDSQANIAKLGSKSVVMLQRLSPEKETEVALRIWQKSRLRDMEWRLDIFGEGEEKERLVEFSKALGISDSVLFHGRTERSIEILLSSSIFLATCPNEHFGLSIIEAMSVGLPILIPESDSSRELLGDDFNSFIYRAKDIEHGSFKLDKLVDNESNLRELGFKLKLRQETQFSLKNFELLAKAYVL